MSATPPPPPANPTPDGGWTLDALRIHLEQITNERDRRYEQRFDAQQAAVAHALTSAEKAVTKAEVATEKRFDSVNEFRETLADQAERFITRHEALTRADANAEKIADLAARLATLEGSKTGAKEDRSSLYASLGAVGALIGIGGFVFAAVK